MVDTWAPMPLDPPQVGFYKTTSIQIEVPYNCAGNCVHVRIQFALKNAMIGHYSVSMSTCQSTPGAIAITRKLILQKMVA